MLPLLAHFTADANRRLGRSVPGFTDDALTCLAGYPWPGNVREVRNVVEAGLVGRVSGPITLDDLPDAVRRCLHAAAAIPLSERERVLRALSETDWNKSQAARRLKWSRMTLYRKLAKYDLDVGRPAGS